MFRATCFEMQFFWSAPELTPCSLSVSLQPTCDKEHVPYVPRVRKGGLWGGVCLSGEGHRQNVRLQEAGKETDQEAERRGDGAQRETDSTESQL